MSDPTQAVLRAVADAIQHSTTFKRYYDDLDGFAREVLGINFWERQKEASRLLVENDRVIISSGHGVGKTLFAGCTCLWGVYARGAIVITTAPTWRQVESILWREINSLHARALRPLSGRVLATTLKLSPDNFAIGLSTNEPERFQGYHGTELIVIEDESPGVNAHIHEAIEGILSGGGKWLKIGNPVASSGPFFVAFNNPSWQSMSISCLEHPNVIENRPVIPGAVIREWTESKRHEWGEDSPLYHARVLGQFPQEGEDTLIRLDWIEDALNRKPLKGPGRFITCDVARFGEDETVIGIWEGRHYRDLVIYRGRDLMQTVGRIIHFFREHNAEAVTVDDDGVGGGVTDRLREQGYSVNAFNGGGKPYSDQFINRRAEAWYSMREHLRAGTVSFEVSDRDIFRYQLSAPKYSFDSRGRIKLESKDEMRKRGISSPDRADCAVMGLMPRPAELWQGIE